MLTNPVKITTALIQRPSITPEDAGVLAVTEGFLAELGFTNHRIGFSDVNTPDVENLYARLGTEGPNFCFAGHLDVVPVGDAAAWTHPPFSAAVVDGNLIGRGAVDMKAAIAAFIAAVGRLKAAGLLAELKGSISLLITLDEEGPAVNGTRKVLHWMEERGERIDACLVGEPTSDKQFGDTVKIGRRGSLNALVTVRGKQGHVAYPDLADNPVTTLVRYLHALKSEPLDNGTKFFPPTNLEVTSVDVGNPTHNIIPASASARLNIRFNDQHDSSELIDWLHQHAGAISDGITLDIKVSGEAFLTPPGELSAIVSDAVEEATGLRPQLSTTGGTSDARFIKDVCPVVEFGARNETAHKVDEQIPLEHIEGLTRVYESVLKRFFKI
jgi:succinyl-diaminopimelate desuccinylase